MRSANSRYYENMDHMSIGYCLALASIDASQASGPILDIVFRFLWVSGCLSNNLESGSQGYCRH